MDNEFVNADSDDPPANCDGLADVAAAERVQDLLRLRLDLTSSLQGFPETIAGLDVSYEAGTRRAAASAAVLDMATLEVKESAVVHGEASFPYVPGLLAFREVPLLLEALGRLRRGPEVLVCDGYGVAHPRRFGLACHIGVLTGLPTFGVAKTPFVGEFSGLGFERGESSSLVERGEVLGRAVRTRTGVKPVFVSVGHRISLDEATCLTLCLSRRYRIPEPIRIADALSREAVRGLDTSQ
jgi:deoxyribonuclease V